LEGQGSRGRSVGRPEPGPRVEERALARPGEDGELRVVVGRSAPQSRLDRGRAGGGAVGRDERCARPLERQEQQAIVENDLVARTGAAVWGLEVVQAPGSREVDPPQLAVTARDQD